MCYSEERMRNDAEKITFFGPFHFSVLDQMDVYDQENVP